MGPGWITIAIWHLFIITDFNIKPLHEIALELFSNKLKTVRLARDKICQGDVGKENWVVLKEDFGEGFKHNSGIILLEIKGKMATIQNTHTKVTCEVRKEMVRVKAGDLDIRKQYFTKFEFLEAISNAIQNHVKKV